MHQDGLLVSINHLLLLQTFLIKVLALILMR
nr:MAG TPA: hypothetical protein [Bacteriophage sp.]